MDDLERYLRRATRGLWGRRRAEVTAELRGSVEARAWSFEAQGREPDEALSMALSELGAPEAISAGMFKEHAVPAIARTTLVAAIVASLSVANLPSGRAQVDAITRSPGPEVGRMSYFSLDGLRARLEALGIKVDAAPRPPQPPRSGVRVPPGTPDPTPTLAFTLPGASSPVTVQALPGMALAADGPFAVPADTREEMLPTGAREGDIYVFDSYLIERLTLSGLPVSLSGWRNPRVTVGSTSFVLGTAERPAYPYSLYGGRAMRALDRAGMPWHSYTFAQWHNGAIVAGFERHAVRVDAEPGTVYAVVTLDSTAAQVRGGPALFLDVSRVSERGVVEFLMPWRVVEFSGDVAAVVADYRIVQGTGFTPSALAKLELGSSDRPARAMLVRLTGRFDDGAPNAEVVVPLRTRSGAFK